MTINKVVNHIDEAAIVLHLWQRYCIYTQKCFWKLWLEWPILSPSQKNNLEFSIPNYYFEKAIEFQQISSNLMEIVGDRKQSVRDLTLEWSATVVVNLGPYNFMRCQNGEIKFGILQKKKPYENRFSWAYLSYRWLFPLYHADIEGN